MRPGVAARAVLLLLSVASEASADPVRLATRFEAGAEYDSNAGRVEEVRGAVPPSIVGSPLARGVGTVDLAAAGGRQWLTLSAVLAGKAFTDARARDEDALVAQGVGAYGLRLAARTGLSASVAYYDVFQRRTVEARDFRSLVPALRLEQGLFGAGQLAAGAGWRSFTYRPQPDYDFSGPTAFASYRHLLPGGDGAADWELAATASVEWRAFAGVRCVDETSCPAPGAARRRDRFWIAGAEATRTGAFLLGVGVAVHGNASNSFGEPLLRGVLHGRAVFLLPLDLSFSARGELYATRYYDPIPLGRDVMGTLLNIDDESRSMLRLELARPLGAHVDAGVRYTYYTNEIADGPVRFRRHTGLVFVAFSWER